MQSRSRFIILCARIQFLRFQRIAWSSPIIDEHRIDGNLAKQIEQLDQKLVSHNRVVVDIKSSITEKRYFQYPLAALQQFTRNTVMHRSYEGTNSAIMVYWFDDRIEIINAGGLFGRMTPENFGRAGFADYRNPDIAKVMKVLGFVQRFGVGVQTAQNELIENQNKPAEFTHELSTTLCKVWADPKWNRKNWKGTKSALSQHQVEILKNCADASTLLEDDLIEMTIPDKPNSRLQKYRLTEKGKKKIH